MSDPTNLPVAVPTLQAQLTQALAQKAGTMVATALLAGGLIPNNMVNQDESLIAGLVVLIISVVWTVVREKIDNARVKTLANAPAASPPVK